MRSEERFGIIYALLLLLWGTLIAEPLRIFTDYFYEAFVSGEKFINVSQDSKLGTLIIVILFVGFTMLLIMANKTSLYRFVPCSIFCTMLVIFLLQSIHDNAVDKKTAAILIVTVLIIAVLHLIKQETVLLWFSDVCALSLSVFVSMGLIVKPLSAINDTMSKIMFSVKDADKNFAACMDGFIDLPGVVWGVFFGILLLLPQIYIVFSGKKG